MSFGVDRVNVYNFVVPFVPTGQVIMPLWDFNSLELLRISSLIGTTGRKEL